MQKSVRIIPRRYSRRFKKQHARVFRVVNKLDRSIQKVGAILKFLQLDGIHHIIDQGRHIFERIVWLFILFALGCGVFYMCYNQWARYKANPTVISLERDYRHWNGTMPAITLCYDIKFNESRVDEYIHRTLGIRSIDKDFEYYSQFVHTIANLTLDTIYTIFDYGEDNRLQNLNLRDLVEFVYPNYNPIIRAFDSGSTPDLKLILSERGMCHVINAPISKVLTTHWTRSIDELGKILTCFMHKDICYIRIDFYNASATIELHSPEEVPVFDSSVFPSNSPDELSITYKVTETLASDSLRSLDLVQRKCVFPSEIFDEIPIYSGKLCEMDCRARNAVELCNCTPFFYPFVDAPECKISGYSCLHKKSWPRWTLRDCKCPESCIHHSYTEHSRSLRQWPDDGLFTLKASFRWEIVSSKMRHRRDIIFSFADFVGSFGGAATLLLGVNIWHLAVACLKIGEKLIQVFGHRNQTF